MDVIDGLEFVRTVAHIDPSTMSKGMFKFVRAAARAAAGARNGDQAVAKFLFPRFEAPQTTPAQDRMANLWRSQDWLLQPGLWDLS